MERDPASTAKYAPREWTLQPRYSGFTGLVTAPRVVLANGGKIRQLMKQQGWSGAALGRKCGTSASIINRLRRNRARERWVEEPNLSRIAGALGVEMEDLMMRVEREREEEE